VDFIPLKSHCTGGSSSIDLKEWFSANSYFANIITELQTIFNQRQVRTK
jgi:hypothetical protein